MELIVAHLGDPVPTVVVIKRQHSPVSLAKVPNPHGTISPTRCKRVQLALVIRNVEHLVLMGSKTRVSRLRYVFPEVNDLDRVFDSKCD